MKAKTPKYPPKWARELYEHAKGYIYRELAGWDTYTSRRYLAKAKTYVTIVRPIRTKLPRISDLTIKQYLNIMRQYLWWVDSYRSFSEAIQDEEEKKQKEPTPEEKAARALSPNVALSFLKQHPHTPYLAALEYLFEANGTELKLSRSARREISQIRRKLSNPNYKDMIPSLDAYVRIWENFPETITGSTKKVFGVGFNRKILPHLKAFLSAQLLWGLRFVDVARTVYLRHSNVEDGEPDRIEIHVVPKGYIHIVKKPPILRSHLSRAMPVLLPVYDYLADFADSHDIDYRAAHAHGNGTVYSPIYWGNSLPKKVGSTYPLRSVYTIYWKVLKWAADKAGVDVNIAPHDGRRTVITELLNAGLPLVAVQRWVGHASPTTTSIYYRWTKGRNAKSIFTMLAKAKQK